MCHRSDTCGPASRRIRRPARWAALGNKVARPQSIAISIFLTAFIDIRFVTYHSPGRHRAADDTGPDTGSAIATAVGYRCLDRLAAAGDPCCRTGWLSVLAPRVCWYAAFSHDRMHRGVKTVRTVQDCGAAAWQPGRAWTGALAAAGPERRHTKRFQSAKAY